MSGDEKGTYETPDYTPEERRWLAADRYDPRPDCPNREQHAVRAYAGRWQEPQVFGFSYPRLDGKSTAKTHRQERCSGCNRFTIWTPSAKTDSGASA